MCVPSWQVLSTREPRGRGWVTSSRAGGEEAAWRARAEPRSPCFHLSSPFPSLGLGAEQDAVCRSWMHNSPLIGAGSGAADSPFLSRAAPFSLCLPAAPADAAADEETRRGRQRSRPALPSPGRHRHGSFRSRLSGSPAISGERPAGCLSCAGGLRCPGSRGWGAGGGLGPLVQSRGVLQLPAALSPPGMTPRTPKTP